MSLYQWQVQLTSFIMVYLYSFICFCPGYQWLQLQLTYSVTLPTLHINCNLVNFKHYQCTTFVSTLSFWDIPHYQVTMDNKWSNILMPEHFCKIWFTGLREHFCKIWFTRLKLCGCLLLYKQEVRF